MGHHISEDPQRDGGERWPGIRARIKSYQTTFERNLNTYASKRGFSSLHDRPFVMRAFLKCWAAPGFHRYWRVWNPGISYFVYRLYLRLQRSMGRNPATVVAFTVSGFAHNAVACPFIGRWSWTLPVAFLFWGAFTVLFRRLEGFLRQDQWPWPANALVNVGLVCLCMDIGMDFNSWVYS
jgi:hypothetical protein